MVNLFINQKSPGKIGNLTLDVTIREQHVYRNDVTAFPVEEGADVTDHVRPLPPRLTMSGVVSNTPLLNVGSLFTSAVESFRNSPIGTSIYDSATRTEQALAELMKLTGWRYPTRVVSDAYVIQRIVPITVVTGLRVYTDMVMTSLTVDRDANTGDSLPFTVELTHISIAKFRQTTISGLESPASSVSKRTSSTKDVGKVTKSMEKPKTSILAKGFNLIVR